MRKRYLIVVVLIISVTLIVLAEERKRVGKYQVKFPPELDELGPVIPADNVPTQEKIELGKLLFFDKRLSADGTVSCASCHNPSFAFTDGQPVPTGMKGQKGRRSAPTVINRVFSSVQFWDGRAPTMEEQAKVPMVDPIEMGNTSHNQVVDRLRKIKGYRDLFKTAFGTEDFNIDHVVKAIASFERNVVSRNSAFDKAELVRDPKPLPESAKRGLKLFEGRARCNFCHGGFNFTDESFHNTGVGTDKPEKERDPGRFNVTKKEEDKGKFKTPTLRDIARTAPYMHDGRFKTLEEVIDFYDKGGVQNPQLDKEIKPLNLTIQEKKDLVEFLKSLSGEGWQQIKSPQKFPQ